MNLFLINFSFFLRKIYFYQGKFVFFKRKTLHNSRTEIAVHQVSQYMKEFRQVRNIYQSPKIFTFFRFSKKISFFQNSFQKKVSV